MSAIVNYRTFRSFQQIVSLRAVSKYSTSPGSINDVKINQGEEEFRTLELNKNKQNAFRGNRKKPAYRRVPLNLPRSSKMPVDQDWPSVWPVARVFHPASVPLPLHQGWVEPGVTPPGKFANAELMKIPNFLHLTPPAIKRQCEALKKFCTEWPKELDSDEKIEKHFPIQITTSDYLHSSPTIRDARARIVTLEVKVKSLNLDEHAKDKLLRLVKERYDTKTDVLTIVADRCPLRQQNVDYAMYLLKVLVSESRKNEPWENEKSEADMERYVWEGSPSQKAIEDLLKRMPSGSQTPPKEQIDRYAQAVTRFHNEGEDVEKLNEYKESVKQLLGLRA
uniref:EOG090X09BG n=1 Tax=Scapholeberis mucronata TaxID=202097 RepID=A0A4Y7NKL8_9CRUS|nr:EOG090X09BG [Scapholeberis mucronata]SVE93732.1 EOG090X09BG [Scapholeberis mucronata]